DIRVVPVQSGPDGGTASTTLPDVPTGLVDHLHQGQRPGALAAGPVDVGALRPQLGVDDPDTRTRHETGCDPAHQVRPAFAAVLHGQEEAVLRLVQLLTRSEKVPPAGDELALQDHLLDIVGQVRQVRPHHVVNDPLYGI